MTTIDRRTADGSDDPVVRHLILQDQVPLLLPWRMARHPRARNFGYAEPDHGLSLHVTEQWMRLAIERPDYVESLGQIAVLQYLRWQGADVCENSLGHLLVGLTAQPVQVMTRHVLLSDWPLRVLAASAYFFCTLVDDSRIQLEGWHTDPDPGARLLHAPNSFPIVR